MAAQTPISYKPAMGSDELKKVVIQKLRYPAVNRFIDEAVREKLERELGDGPDSKTKRLVNALEEAVKEYKGWTMHKPTQSQIREIEKRAKAIEEGKTKPVRWKGTF